MYPYIKRVDKKYPFRVIVWKLNYITLYIKTPMNAVIQLMKNVCLVIV